MRSGLIPAFGAAAVAVVVTLGFFYLQGSPATRVGPGDPLPPLDLPAADDGRRVRLDELRGPKAHLLVFDDMRTEGGVDFAVDIQKLHRRYRHRGVITTAIAFDHDYGLKEVMRRNLITYAVLLDPGGAASRPLFGDDVKPGDAYLVGNDGRVRAVFKTPEDWTKRRVQHALEEALREQG